MEDIITNPAICSDESVVAMERIYIGGFVEDRLSAKDIVNRLQTNPPDGIRFVSFDVFPTFVFATLCHNTTTTTTTTTTATAVQIVAAQYNNVRWKGCKLKVEPAKPHILQVFAHERQQQQQQQQLQQQTVSTPTTSILLPRHLRIRRRRGEEITKVDTKPKTIQIPITSTTSAKIRRNTLSSLKNRALHIRFQDVEEEFSPLNSNNHNNNVSEEDSSSSCSTDNTSTTSSSNESLNTLPFTNLNACSKSKYQWSDEEDDEEEDNDDVTTSVSSSSNTDHRGIELDTDLSRDVSNNMNILSQLFPDLQHETNHISENSNAQQQHHQQQQHQRYDPTSASAKQFEIIRPSNNTTNTMEQENSDVLLQKNSEILQTTNDDSITNDTNTTIYQEKKLETIFQCSTLKTKQKLNDSSTVKSGFGFEFPFEEDTKEEVDDSTNDILPRTTSTATNTIVQVVEEDTNSTTTVVGVDDSKKRRLGFVFPQQLLDQWEEEFFAMDATMTDEEWEERRKTLTLDWKRKYKLVKTQEQQRTKKRMSK